MSPLVCRAAEIPGDFATSPVGTKQTRRPALTLSVAAGRPEVAVVRSNRREYPQQT